MSSYWREEQSTSYPLVAKDISVDVAVIGGGITGVTTAYALLKRGLKVCLLEKGCLCDGDSGNTTAHLTYVTDQSLQDLVKSFGKDHGPAVWQAGEAAIEFIHETVESLSIDCSFRWIPGFYHQPCTSTSEKQIDQLHKEAELAAQHNFESIYRNDVSLMKKPGVEFAHQAKFHPVKYIRALAQNVYKLGGEIFENSEVQDFDEKNKSLKVNGHTISYTDVVIATHVPLQGIASTIPAAFQQTKMYPYTSYVIRAELVKGNYKEALYWDMESPYHYLRIDKEGEKFYAIFGGRDEKTGQERDSTQLLNELGGYLGRIIPVQSITHNWLGQVIETDDGLPFIGEFTNHQFIATGFSGNGFTFGTLSGLMIADQITKTRNPWTKLFDPHRSTALAGAWDYLTENVDYPYYLLRDRFKEAEQKSPELLEAGEGEILKIKGQKVAACRTQDGQLSLVSPACTHVGCYVRWNKAGQTWDCPCHGSRFSPDGKVIAGPAETPLERVDVD